MNDVALRVEHLGKSYRIGRVHQRHDTLRDAFADSFRAFTGRLQRGSTPAASDNIVWALRDVSFEVRQGETLGIVGPNGAGKSTLLKILSRITVPTEGRVDICGRVRSLLEVGTGFHPELTGRENIYLNGAILGMKKAETARKFDEIVAFAQIDQFLDTPVKRYSSGMYVRLAFAVAAHLEPEILLVDEVLAVGDAAFQKKCLGKMGTVAKEGRTVLFVSHNMAAVNSLTGQSLYITGGRLAAHGPTNMVIEQYLMEARAQQTSQGKDLDLYRREFSVDTPIRTSGVRVDATPGGPPVVRMGDAFTVHVRVQVTEAIRGAHMDITLKNARGERVVLIFSRDQGCLLDLDLGEHVISAEVRDLTLAPGHYLVDIGINQSTTTKAYDVILDCPAFRIVSHEGIVHWVDRPWGAVHCDTVAWHTSKLDTGEVW